MYDYSRGGRDSQRSRLYQAENALPTDLGLTPAGVQRFVDKVQQSPYTIRKYGKGHVRLVLDSRRRRVAVATASGTIDLSAKWARRKDVVLHELAHHYAGFSHGHDWRFCEVLLDLTRHFMGAERANALKASMKKYRVRFTPPRAKAPRTPAQIAAAEAGKARLAAARAARQGASGAFGILLTDASGHALVSGLDKWGRVTKYTRYAGARSNAKVWKTQAGVTEAFAKVSKVIERHGSHKVWNATPMTALVVDLNALSGVYRVDNEVADVTPYVVRF